MIKAIFISFTLTGIFFSSSLFAETRIYDNNYKLKYRIKEDGRIYDKDYKPKGRIEDNRIYDEKYRLKYRIDGDRFMTNYNLKPIDGDKITTRTITQGRIEKKR